MEEEYLKRLHSNIRPIMMSGRTPVEKDLDLFERTPDINELYVAFIMFCQLFQPKYFINVIGDQVVITSRIKETQEDKEHINKMIDLFEKKMCCGLSLEYIFKIREIINGKW